jgi:O-antigen/teichoic acid export membrane protein
MLTTGENYLNIRKQSSFFLVASLIRLGLNIGANLYFIIVLRLGAKGMLYGEFVSTGIVGTVLLFYLIKQNDLSFRLHLLGRMLKFGLPFIPNMLSAVLVHRVDRYLLQKFTSLADVGIYGLGYKFPFMLNSLILDSFGRIWYASVMYDIAKQEHYRRTYAKITTYFVTVYVVCQYILAVMAPTVIKILAAPEYFEAWKVVQIVGLGLCCYAIYTFFVIGAYIKSKTWYLPISYLLSAFINIGLNWYFLPRYGYIAAAWNTVVTYSAFSLLNFLIFRKQYPIPFEFRRLGVLFGGAIGLVLLSNVLHLQQSLPECLKELIFSAILPGFLLFGKYLDQEEKVSLCEELQKIHPQLAGVYRKVTLQ